MRIGKRGLAPSLRRSTAMRIKWVPAPAIASVIEADPIKRLLANTTRRGLLKVVLDKRPNPLRAFASIGVFGSNSSNRAFSTGPRVASARVTTMSFSRRATYFAVARSCGSKHSPLTPSVSPGGKFRRCNIRSKVGEIRVGARQMANCSRRQAPTPFRGRYRHAQSSVVWSCLRPI
jgi:hypothetical protein